MPAARPKGHAGGNRTTPGTPMSERQQMALLMQMTSQTDESGSRSPPAGSSLRSRNRNEKEETPLHLAAIKGDVEQVTKLLAHHADPNSVDAAGWTPLHKACSHGWYEVTCRLIQAGANVNAQGSDNDTPLHDAAANGHLKVVKFLIDKGADINAKNSKGKTPLDVATSTVSSVMLNSVVDITEPGVSTRLQPRTRDEKKVTESNKQKYTASEETMDPTKTNPSEDVYEFKSVKESSPSPDHKSVDPQDVETDVADQPSTSAVTTEESTKRNFSEIADNEESATDEESKKKKRKDDNTKDSKGAVPLRNAGQTKGQANKQTSSTQNKTSAASSVKGIADRKSPPPSPKPASASDAELEDGKSDLKVPPLKIVIPQSSSSEPETGANRNGKNSSLRSHQALPYVVPSSNNETAEKDATSGTTSPTENNAVKNEDKKETVQATDDQRSGHHQRVLRSSHRSGPVQGSVDRSSNNSSPQLQRSHSPSPSASPSTPSNQPETSTSTLHNNSTATTSKTSDTQVTTNSDTEQTASASNVNSNSNISSVELHPRKRKMRPSKELPAPSPAHETTETLAVSEIHPHEQPITNCYQLFLNIRKQIEKRRRGLFPVQPKPPQGFKDYLMNRCTYVLADTAPTTPNITHPSTLPTVMKDLYSDQEKERYRLRMQHVIEKEKLVLSVEQEILRVHGRAARALANQSLPFSVCTILRDEEVYNLITPEQEEKDRNARSRYNGRLFLSWLQDVDDKWEKIKEHMLLRHHNEAESLNAVQKMDWEWKLKELSLCDAKATPIIDELHVPMVHVSDDFDLLPA